MKVSMAMALVTMTTSYLLLIQFVKETNIQKYFIIHIIL